MNQIHIYLLYFTAMYYLWQFSHLQSWNKWWPWKYRWMELVSVLFLYAHLTCKIFCIWMNEKWRAIQFPLICRSDSNNSIPSLKYYTTISPQIKAPNNQKACVFPTNKSFTLIISIIRIKAKLNILKRS